MVIIPAGHSLVKAGSNRLLKARSYLRIDIQRSSNSGVTKSLLYNPGGVRLVSIEGWHDAERLVNQYGEILHYCYERKRWLVWNRKV